MKNLKVHPYICDTCFLNIQSYGYPCVIVTELVWAFYIEKKKFTYRDNDETHKIAFKIPVAFLESKKIFISTEIEKGLIQVVPNFSSCSFKNGENKFCWCGT